MDSLSREPFRLTLRVNHKRWIRLGVCQLKSAIEHEFCMWDWSVVGHGHYCVSSIGGVISHTDSNLNWKIKGFKIAKGDTIEMKYDPARGRFRVTKAHEEF